ncbi:uncharacterized protein LOC126687168 [Mercurialis annua]|uniref:uncharacterized protein LOC126687168 n=1 Tax=Mercurialis annua TaxID=3986 RepID=UPI0021605BCD|nr:uncharacterized protein LOC126687168 [Mercurialis annua]
METIDEIAYEDFEPYCKWQREEGCDLLEVHVQDFKKEHLRVQLKGDVLSITGEYPVNNNIRKRFLKKLKISKQCEATEIRAKFSKRGILTVSLPKKISSSTSKKLGSSNGDGSFNNASLPSLYLVGQESSSNYLAKLNRNLARQVAAVVLAMAFGAFVYNYCCCARAC